MKHISPSNPNRLSRSSITVVLRPHSHLQQRAGGSNYSNELQHRAGACNHSNELLRQSSSTESNPCCGAVTSLPCLSVISLLPTWFGVASYATYLWHWLWNNFWVTLILCTVAALTFAWCAGLMAVQVSTGCITPSTITWSVHTRSIFSKLKRRWRKDRLATVYLEQVKGQPQTTKLMQALWLKRRTQASSLQW